jgi:hypothetical protein
MKIAIVGGGWLGCHLANKLKNDHNIKIYEKDNVFSGVSTFNQNRLHLGYHYARSYKTRKLCIDTFDRFINDYKFLTKEIKNNLYAIPEKESNIDFNTYLKIFNEYSHNIVEEKSLSNVEGTISVNEKYIDNEKAKIFFIKELKDKIIYKKITKDDLLQLSKDNDLVIDCTNNKFLINSTIKKNIGHIFFYKKIKENNFLGLTLVDGNLFSIFPYKDDIFSITDVLITTDNSISLKEKINLLENKITFYYKNFLKDFKYYGTEEIVRNKQYGMSDSRVPEIIVQDNILSCFIGKIQGIYYVEDYIKDNYNV